MFSYLIMVLKINSYNQIHFLSIRMTSKSLKSLTDQSLRARFRKRKRSAWISQKEKNIFFLLPAASQFAVIMHYSIVAKITLNVDLNTRVHALTGVLFTGFDRASLLPLHITLCKIFCRRKDCALREITCYRTSWQNTRQEASKGFLWGDLRYFLGYSLCFSSVSGLDGVILKRQATNSIEEGRGGFHPGLFF